MTKNESTEDIVLAFRERPLKKTAILIRLNIEAKSLIEEAAGELDLDVSVFVRKALEKEVMRVLAK